MSLIYLIFLDHSGSSDYGYGICGGPRQPEIRGPLLSMCWSPKAPNGIIAGLCLLWLGNYLLMMFYTTVGGWMAAYIFKTADRRLPEAARILTAVRQFSMTCWPAPGSMTFWMVLAGSAEPSVSAVWVCRKAWSASPRSMMCCLLLILLVLCIRSVTLPGRLRGTAAFI